MAVRAGTAASDGDPVREDLLQAWTTQLVTGEALDPLPATARERRVADALKNDIEKIQSDGGVVEIPPSLPG